MELSWDPQGSQANNGKWVFAEKRDKEGSLVKHKARLVDRGFVQKEDIDYKATFAPVADATTIRLVMAISAALDLKVQQFDVKGAFLNGKLKETLYLAIPEGYFEIMREIAHDLVDADLLNRLEEIQENF